MTDDIVTRLRNCAWVRPESEWATQDDKTIAEAADEIERLRAEIAQITQIGTRQND
jgi:hypothetical protein